MRQVTIRKLRDRLTQELRDLPVQVLKDGEIIATITPYLDSDHKLAQPEKTVDRKSFGYATRDVPSPVWLKPLETKVIK